MPLVSETSAVELARALAGAGVAVAQKSGVTGYPAGTWRDVTLPQDRGPGLVEPAASGTLERLDGAIRRRRSVREFAERPVTARHLSPVLRAARTAAPVWRGLPLEVLVAISGRDQRPGLFQTDESGALTGALPGESLVTELRDSYAPAPALLLICGTVPTVGEYRGTLLAASSCGYTAWLAAIALGMDGCVFGRAHGKVTAAVRSFRGPADRHLFTVALGWPQDAG